MNGFLTEMIQSLERFQEELAELAGARSSVNVAARNASSLLIPRPPGCSRDQAAQNDSEKAGCAPETPGGIWPPSPHGLRRETPQSSCRDSHLLGGLGLQ